MSRSWRVWAFIGFIAFAAAGFYNSAAAEGNSNWTMERPSALAGAASPIVESATQDGESDPPPPGAPALLQAAQGVGALAGRVLQAEDGAPLAGVELRLGTKRVRSGPDGLFLIEDAPVGANVLIIDGRQARTKGAGGAVDHGVYEARVKVERGRTTQLPWVSWLPKIDHSHDVAVPKVLDKQVIVANPNVPGVELKLPAGAVLTGLDGERVTKLSVTRLNVRRAPFPMSNQHRFSIYATFQPGGATISGAHGEWLGAQIVYSNFLGLKAGSRTELWAYDPDQTGWRRYGYGRVSADRRRIEGEAGARLYALTGFTVPVNYWPPFINNPPCIPCLLNALSGGNPGSGGRPGAGGDPVDLATGLFIHDRRDLYVDDVMPIEVRRTYVPDGSGRAFGLGMSLSYDMFFVAADTCDPGVMYTADGSAIPFVPTNPNTAGCGTTGGWITTAPGLFYNSTVIQDPVTHLWVLTRPDNWKFYFGNFADESLWAIEDPHGNRIRIVRDGNLNATQIISPNGRHIYLTYATSQYNSRIVSASDDLGHTVNYAYGSNSTLTSVVDADGKTTSYGWNSSNSLLTTITFPNSGVLTNVYDANGRVSSQTQPDGGQWTFAYTLNPAWTPSIPGTLNAGGAVSATSVTDPRGNVEKFTFNAFGEILTDVKAYGTSLQSTYAYTLDPASQRPTAMLDPLGRTTAYTYDASGRPLIVTRLSGTADAVTTTYTYAWPTPAVATVTDPLGHTTTYGRNAAGDLLSLTDPLGYAWNYTYDAQGHVLTATDPLSNQTTYTYTNGALATVTDPLNRTTSYFEDALGRLTRTQNPAGGVTKITYDPLYGPTQTLDPNGAATTLAYSATGALASVTDARGGVVAYGYDLMNRLSTYTDALGKVATINSRDGLGEILKATDRKGQVATYTYDALNRLATATYADGSTVSYTYDLGGRLTQVQDSVGGTITRAYDGLDRLTSETTAQGTVTYTYDAASRLTSLQAPNQALINYAYDNDDRLTSITQGTASVTFAYDNASRRISGATTADSWVYGYDAASELTSIAYTGWSGGSLGTLTYNYGLDGSVTSRSGTLFTSVLPAAVTSAAYDAGNRLTSRVTSAGTQTPAWDANGSLTSDGINSFTWDARNRMTAIGSQASFVYDAFGRRASVTKNGMAAIGYLYSGDNVIQEQQSGAVLAAMLTGLGIDERYVRAGELVLTDLLGSTVALSNGSSNQTTYAYDPYGVTTSAGAATYNTYQFTGRENDGTTASLMFYRARYYNPAWGRFVSEDPIGVAGGVNLYAYVQGQPTRWVDPQGRAADSPPFEGPPGSTDVGRKQSRKYGPDGYPETDRDLPHPNESGPGADDHCHDWGRPNDGGRPTHEDRGPPRYPFPTDPPPPTGYPFKSIPPYLFLLPLILLAPVGA